MFTYDDGEIDWITVGFVLVLGTTIIGALIIAFGYDWWMAKKEKKDA
ncbi:MAG TPA: hypothetical protein VJM10_03935 [Candidatus Methylomirabilis sp.]|nr:hypothetical protein [Candidatus Methylomirabilis sp.]